MMAMSALDPGYALSRREELQLWRESTTTFMTSGHGGCHPHGLVLSAAQRGFSVKVWIIQEGPLFARTSDFGTSRLRTTLIIKEQVGCVML